MQCSGLLHLGLRKRIQTVRGHQFGGWLNNDEDFKTTNYIFTLNIQIPISLQSDVLDL